MSSVNHRLKKGTTIRLDFAGLTESGLAELQQNPIAITLADVSTTRAEVRIRLPKFVRLDRPASRLADNATSEVRHEA